MRSRLGAFGVTWGVWSALCAFAPCALPYPDGGLAILCGKALTAELDGRQVIDNAVLLVKDGKIEAVGARDALQVPDGYEVLDVGGSWVMPGMIDLHSHVGGTRADINDMVYQANPGLRVTPTVVPGYRPMRTALAAGVTTILYIPGSGTNIGGQGVLMKTVPDTYDAILVRDPGSLKIAQGDNPKRWFYRMNRALMNWNLRNTLRRGLAYARSWRAFERGDGPRPERDIQFDVFRDLLEKRTQVSTHTQYYQLVMMTIQMLAVDFGLDVYIDHGSFDSYLNADRAIEAGVAAILGPREVMWPRPPAFDTDGQVQGSAWGFQQAGHERIGFNTDAPVVPPELLPLQAAMGVRYGMDDRNMEQVRGVTIIPAVTAGIEALVGSLEPGKDADVLVVTGDPTDPRHHVELVLVKGRTVYDATEGRLW